MDRIEESQKAESVIEIKKAVKSVRLIAAFYKSIAFASTLVTVVCIALILLAGVEGIHILQPLIWFKLFTLFVIFYVTNQYKNNEYYYYRNLGISKLRLWIPILAFDFMVFLISTITIAGATYEPLPGS